MAAARQNEMKVSITEVATKTLMAGRCKFSACVDIVVRAAPGSVRFAGTLQPEYISVLPLVLIGQCLTNFGEHFQLDASPRHSEGRPKQRDEKFTTEARRSRRKLYGTKTPCLCVGACPERSRRVVNDFRRSGAPAENFTPASSVGRAGAESKAPRLESTCYFRSVK